MVVTSGFTYTITGTWILTPEKKVMLLFSPWHLTVGRRPLIPENQPVIKNADQTLQDHFEK